MDDPRVRWPGKDRVFGRMEELIQQFKGVTEGPPVPPGEAYAAIESPNGELGFYVVSDGTGKPYKVRCRPPSFANVAPMRGRAGSMMSIDMAVSDISAMNSTWGKGGRSAASPSRGQRAP